MGKRSNECTSFAECDQTARGCWVRWLVGLTNEGRLGDAGADASVNCFHHWAGMRRYHSTKVGKDEWPMRGQEALLGRCACSE